MHIVPACPSWLCGLIAAQILTGLKSPFGVRKDIRRSLVTIRRAKYFRVVLNNCGKNNKTKQKHDSSQRGEDVSVFSALNPVVHTVPLGSSACLCCLRLKS